MRLYYVQALGIPIFEKLALVLRFDDLKILVYRLSNSPLFTQNYAELILYTLKIHDYMSINIEIPYTVPQKSCLKYQGEERNPMT